MRLRLCAGALGLTMALAPTAVFGQSPEPTDNATDLPVMSAEVPRGTYEVVSREAGTPTAKVVDGDISDWAGQASRYGGTATYSAGEYIYQDHLFDATGADDGRDVQRLETTKPLDDNLAISYRIDALMAQADAPGQLGVDTPEQISWDDSYGDAGNQTVADLEEVRIAVTGDTVNVLARTTNMYAPGDAALLVLADTADGSNAATVPFSSNLSSVRADVAYFINGSTGQRADLGAQTIEDLPAGSVATNPDGFTNAIEVALPLADVVAPDGSLSLAVATGKGSGGPAFAPLELDVPVAGSANIANVAFRTSEPVRTWFDKEQALALHGNTIDPFFTSIDVAKLNGGATEVLVPEHGYHDRLFVSDPDVSREQSKDGLFQHYGLYLPAAIANDEPLPMQVWLHWRGGTAHSGAAVVPRVISHFGDRHDSIVIAPFGRGTSRWYVGEGHVDFLEVWADAFDTAPIDSTRVYVSGHSMGGWGSYLLGLLYPDRFAAAAPYAGPPTQGLWTGVDFPGCDEMQAGDYTPCYGSANDGRPRDQHTRKLIENARHVPFAIMHGTDDELVPYSGVVNQAQRFRELNYRFRFYTYPGYEHFTHPAMDQWTEAADYMHQFRTDPNPAWVTYVRDMPFERATEEVQARDELDLDFDFDSAYWMSGLEPVDEISSHTYFDGRSLAIADTEKLVIPDTTPPARQGTTGPYATVGLQWIDDPTAAVPSVSNGFEITLSEARAVTLDLERMAISTAEEIAGVAGNDNAIDLSLIGGWTEAPEVLVNGVAVTTALVDGVLTFQVPAGQHDLTIAATPPATPILEAI